MATQTPPGNFPTTDEAERAATRRVPPSRFSMGNVPGAQQQFVPTQEEIAGARTQRAERTARLGQEFGEGGVLSPEQGRMTPNELSAERERKRKYQSYLENRFETAAEEEQRWARVRAKYLSDLDKDRQIAVGKAADERKTAAEGAALDAERKRNTKWEPYVNKLFGLKEGDPGYMTGLAEKDIEVALDFEKAINAGADDAKAAAALDAMKKMILERGNVEAGSVAEDAVLAAADAKQLGTIMSTVFTESGKVEADTRAAQAVADKRAAEIEENRKFEAEMNQLMHNTDEQGNLIEGRALATDFSDDDITATRELAKLEIDMGKAKTDKDAAAIEKAQLPSMVEKAKKRHGEQFAYLFDGVQTVKQFMDAEQEVRLQKSAEVSARASEALITSREQANKLREDAIRSGEWARLRSIWDGKMNSPSSRNAPDVQGKNFEQWATEELAIQARGGGGNAAAPASSAPAEWVMPKRPEGMNLRQRLAWDVNADLADDGNELAQSRLDTMAATFGK